MGAIWLHQLPDVLRAAGLNVETYSGWETRSRSSGGYDRILGIGVHHDAVPTDTPLANRLAYCWDNAQDRPIGALFLWKDGTVIVGAAGATNTQGKGGPYQCSRGMTPQDQANRYWISVEAANNGVGEAWPVPMQEAYVTLCAALVAEFDLQPSDVVAHFEWTTRKVDPAGNSRYAAGAAEWNMDLFRSDVGSGVVPDPGPDPDPDPPLPPADPRNGVYGLYPLDTSKPTLRRGSGPADKVQYLQGVLVNEAGQSLDISGSGYGSFGPQTEAAVENLQRFFGITADGVVGWDGSGSAPGPNATWPIIDFLATQGDAPDPPEPPPTGVEKVNPGYYWVRSGDSPWSAAERIYGSGSEYPKLQPTSPPSPGFNAPGHAIRTPGVAGLDTEVLAGEGPYAVLDRLGIDRGQLDVFYAFNGGDGRTLHAGDSVFMPT